MLQQEDIPNQCQHVAVADFLDMLGLPLYATFSKTRKEMGDDFQQKSKNKVGGWLIKHMCMTQRPWSLNTFMYPKFYHRCHCIPLRQCDVKQIVKQSNRFLFCDQLEKPGPIATYRSRNNGGLGLHNVEIKAKALLIKCFLETAANPRFQHSLFHEAIFSFYVLGNRDFKDPKLPPYFSKDMMNEISMGIKNGYKVVTLSSKQWYDILLNEHVLEEAVPADPLLHPPDPLLPPPDPLLPPPDPLPVPRQPKKCKSEIELPEINWPETWYRARMKGLTNPQRTFMFRFLHNILPTQARLHRVTRTTPSPVCQMCDSGEGDDLWRHSYTQCAYMEVAMEWLLGTIKNMDPSATLNKIMFLQFEPLNSDNLLACVFLTSEALSCAWARRRRREPLDIHELKSNIRAKCKILAMSKLYSACGTNLLAIL